MRALKQRCAREHFCGRGRLSECGGRPKRIMFGNLEGAVRKGRGGKEKEWTDRIQSDIRAFDIAGDKKVTALEGEM